MNLIFTWKGSSVQLELPEPAPEREDTEHKDDPWAKQTKPCKHRSQDERISEVCGDDGAQVSGEVEEGAWHGLQKQRQQ